MDMKKDFSEAANEIILESISDGVFTVDHNWRIMSFNRAAEKITGTPREEAIGRFCWEVFRSNMCEGDCALKRTIKKKKSYVSTSTYIINNVQQRVPIGVSTSLLRNDKGEILGGVETFRDRTLVEELRREITASYVLGDMVSRSVAMQKIFNILPQVAESDSTVLIVVYWNRSCLVTRLELLPGRIKISQASLQPRVGGLFFLMRLAIPVQLFRCGCYVFWKKRNFNL